MQVEDPDGNVLRFGSDPKEGQPYGEWFDMRGVRWAHKPGGGWNNAAPVRLEGPRVRGRT